MDISANREYICVSLSGLCTITVFVQLLKNSVTNMDAYDYQLERQWEEWWPSSLTQNWLVSCRPTWKLVILYLMNSASLLLTLPSLMYSAPPEGKSSLTEIMFLLLYVYLYQPAESYCMFQWRCYGKCTSLCNVHMCIHVVGLYSMMFTEMFISVVLCSTSAKI